MQSHDIQINQPGRDGFINRYIEFSLTMVFHTKQRLSLNVNRENKRKKMEKILSTGSYGICLFSLDVLQDFLKKEKLKSKKLLEVFQKKPDCYVAALKEGAWVPFVQLDSVEYVIKLDGCEPSFSDEWEQKMECDGFNIEIMDTLWITDIGAFTAFEGEEFIGNDEISYETLDNEKLYSGFKYYVDSGKYLVSIRGFARREQLDFPNPNYGFAFSLVKVDAFSGFKNPREEIYDFNVANM